MSPETQLELAELEAGYEYLDELGIERLSHTPDSDRFFSLTERIRLAVLAERQANARAVCPRCAQEIELHYIKSSGVWIHYSPDPERYFEFCNAAPVWERGRVLAEQGEKNA